MRRVVLIRHALTDYNISGMGGRICGRFDPPLNSKGNAEAKEIGRFLRKLPYQKVFSSPLLRAVQTGECMLDNHDLQIHISEEITEIDYGVWEGLSKEDVRRKYPQEYELFKQNPIKCFPPKGEDPVLCSERAVGWLEKIDCNIAIAISHKTLIRLLLCRVLAIPLQSYRDSLDIKIGGLTVIISERDKWRIEAINYGATTKRVLGF